MYSCHSVLYMQYSIVCGMCIVCACVVVLCTYVDTYVCTYLHYIVVCACSVAPTTYVCDMSSVMYCMSIRRLTEEKKEVESEIQRQPKAEVCTYVCVCVCVYVVLKLC